ncbi:MAG: NlpC/P60 family protein [Clostridiales bacterium]|nr:NlpC/P60 family protein [Clostridiales bacterium]
MSWQNGRQITPWLTRHRSACAAAGLMIICGGVASAIAESYVPITEPVLEEIVQNEDEPRPENSRERITAPKKQTATASVAEEGWVPSLDDLNLAYLFPEGADTTNIAESYAYDAFQTLMREDSNWMSHIYGYSDNTPAEVAALLGISAERVLGDYNPNDSSHDADDPTTWTIGSFKSTRVTATDGDGHAISPKSNVIDIMSMANVYTYYQGADQYDLFLSYAQKLWELSHFYQISISDVYYCSGCVGEDADGLNPEDLEDELTEEEQKQLIGDQEDDSPSEALSSVITAGTTRTDASQTEEETETEPESKSAVIRVGAESEAPASETEKEESESETEDGFTAYATTTETIAAFPTESEETAAEREEVQSFPESQTAASEEMETQTSRIIHSGGSGITDSETTENENSETEENAGEENREAVETLPDENEETAETFADTVEEQISHIHKASPSNASYCPGHVDLIVHLEITGLDETASSLFSLDAVGNDPAQIGTGAGEWPGWTDDLIEAARNLAAQDWYERYGLSVSIISPGNPLTEADIESYMALLPDDISETRRALIRFALNSVGKVPYYWCGKASRPGYEGNNFGIPVAPDEDGRILKGLDCSGWINWVYWSVTGERLPYESTAGLAFTGTGINREDLLPGDIIIRTGSEAHVIMFLGWESDGRILCINETSGSDNNVVVTSREASWPYYRRLID